MDRVSDIMTRNVVTLSPDDSAEDAIETLVQQRISGAPVVDAEGRLLGVLTEYHLLKIASFPALTQQTVGELMTKAVWVIAEDADLTAAAELLAKHRIRRLPVVDQGRVVGVVSRRDIIQHLLMQRREFAGRKELPKLCERLLSAIGHERPPRAKRVRREKATLGSAR